jgi:6-aminohexanoate-oligomer exohydrolase
MTTAPRGFDPSDWKAWPHTPWAFRNIEHFLPTARVAAPAAAAPIPVAIEEPAVGDALTWSAYLNSVQATSAILVRKGRIVVETYRSGLTATDRHTLFSITKTITGLAALLLAERGAIDLERTACAYVPELCETAFGAARLIDLLAMRDGVPFDESYADPSSEIHAYSRHYWGGAPGGTKAALRALRERPAEPGRFAYRTPVADVIGWALSRASGLPLAALVSELVWKPIGAEDDALMILDTAGAEIAGTGFTARPRDLARLASALLSPDASPFPPVVRDQLFAGGDPDAVSAAGYATRPGWSYAALTWCPRPGRAAALGVHGQRLYLDRTSGTALIVTAAAPQPDTRHLDHLHEAALASVMPAEGGELRLRSRHHGTNRPPDDLSPW